MDQQVLTHWRDARADAEAYRPSRRVLVLVPDLELDGGVTHYYRTLGLDRIEQVDYFFVNRPFTRTRFEKAFYAMGIFTRFLRRLPDYGLIHVNPSLTANSFFRDCFFVLAGKLARRRVLVFFRGWEPEFEAQIRRRPLLRTLFRCSYARADRLIVLGETFRRRLLALGLDRRVPVHIDTTVADSAGLEELDLHAKFARVAESCTCLYLARVLKRKGVLTAIDAVATCNAMLGRPAVRLVVAGDGPDLVEARKRAANLSCIEFVGDVRGAAKVELLRRAHVLLFPTCYGEGLPNCVIEAMLAGQVVMTRDVGAIREVAEDGNNGFVTESTDPAAFAAYLAELMARPARFEEIGQRNRAVAQLCCETAVRGRVLDTYRVMLDDTDRE